MSARDRLRLAVQKSGRLAEPSRELLARCGLSFRESRDRLFCYGETLPIDLLLVRDDDIPGLLQQGVCDLGIVGRNVLAEALAASESAGENLREWLPLGFGACRLALAVPQEWGFLELRELAGKRIATSYPMLLRRWLEQRGLRAEIVVLSGSVEIAPRLGTADLICDLVSTGATLAANQLREVATVLESEAVLAGPVRPFGDERAALAELLLRRLRGVLEGRASRLVMMRAPVSALAEIERRLPRVSARNVLPLADAHGAVAIQALCGAEPSWAQLEELKRLGVENLLVLPVEKALL
ncbi:MAG: ATP phosphoribosyltransferase [Lysobacterales bacterium]|jgi:ATP phosphoribosyltransferase|nr:MAG: ATP phosphoribosyltransferase [Xanthomonadales bacterium]